MIKKISCVICGEFNNYVWLNSPSQVSDCNVIANRGNEPTLLRHAKTHGECEGILLRGTIERDDTDGNITIVLKNIWEDEDESLQRTPGQKQLDKDRIQGE
jgi:hypothetical protein